MVMVILVVLFVRVRSGDCDGSAIENALNMETVYYLGVSLDQVLILDF